MIRITGGSYKGRKLAVPSGGGTRASQAKLRQALFNSIQFHLDGAKILDLFSGSGSLGFEALSRGASFVVFVEKEKKAIDCIKENAAALKVLDQVKIVGKDYLEAARDFKFFGPYDVALADPPYDLGAEEKLLTQLDWNSLLTPDGIFCLEWGNQHRESVPDRVQVLVKNREKTYGDSVLTHYTRKELADVRST